MIDIRDLRAAGNSRRHSMRACDRVPHPPLAVTTLVRATLTEAKAPGYIGAWHEESSTRIQRLNSLGSSSHSGGQFAQPPTTFLAASNLSDPRKFTQTKHCIRHSFIQMIALLYTILTLSLLRLSLAQEDHSFTGVGRQKTERL